MTKGQKPPNCGPIETMYHQRVGTQVVPRGSYDLGHRGREPKEGTGRQGITDPYFLCLVLQRTALSDRC
eukprot:CAMPEP_0174362086 /NCGR_PEP_ID=MMETSP0811_2-20130205/62557_1 /TAXON_ID=73025 ORGANISM="Eutreptiella gymnastica-like, Strain CCMP1594" /NCGR_SAMPLE_ID=MMETSP0811_2 /ASSEMBLY_ACC=CAM_ASM_000667 /LENGTH=68 /DNA_ID=CAMNT_0015499383 /DNA_START=31 /DNA_END=237 /DNA_ORIENTATION=-